MRLIMAKFLQAGIAAVLACSFCLLSPACAAKPVGALQCGERVKFEIIAHCLQALSDSFEKPPEIVVVLYKSTSAASPVAAPNWFLNEVDRKNIRVGSERDAKPGISFVGIYLDRVEAAESGEIILSFTEVYSLSEKFLHEFVVSMTSGSVEKVVLVRTTKL